MLKQIYEFALKHCDSPKDSTFRQKRISGYINIDENGEYQYFEFIEKPEYSSFPCRGLGGDSCNVFVENMDVVLFCDEARTKRSNNYYENIKENSDKHYYINAMRLFLEKLQCDDTLKNKILEEKSECKTKNALLSFKVNENKIEEDTDIQSIMCEIINADKKDGIWGVSSLTGQYVELETSPVMFRFGESGGHNPTIAPFSKAPSTSSYCQSGTIISRLGVKETALIKEGFEILLNDSNHRNRFFKLSYWFDDDQNNEKGDFISSLLFSNKENENNQTMTNVLKGFETLDNSKIGNVQNEYFNIFFCKPGDSRYHCYGNTKWNVKDLYNNLKKFKEDATIVLEDGSIETIDNLRDYLYLFVPKQIERSKWDKYVENRFGVNIDRLIYSLFGNQPLPRIFLQYSLHIAAHYISIDKYRDFDKQTYSKKQYLNSIKTIKLYNNRKDDSMRNENACKCGKIFAVYEALQKAATDGVSVSEKFSVAQKKPKMCIAQCSKMVPIYLNTLRRNGKKELAGYYENMLNALYDGMDIPETLSLVDQGDFTIGYHEQKIKIYEKKGDNNHE